MQPRPVAPTPAAHGAVPVLVVDAHELMGAALGAALRASGVDASATTPAALPGLLAARRRTGVAVVDLDPERFPTEEIALVRVLTDRGRRVLVLGSAADPLPTAAAVAAGAVGQVSRSAPFTALVEAVSAAARGWPVMSDADRRHWLDLDRGRLHRSRQEQRVISELTPREHTVLQRLARGHKAAVIAAENGVSLETVRSQIRSIRVKLGVSSQLEAVALLRAARG
jgi:DNA-binding NarL/FixJ family response regulator